MSVLLAWEGGRGQVAIARLDGEMLEVHASMPSAPGSRPSITLPGGGLVRMKVHRCRAIAAGAPPPPDPALGFYLEGRLIDQSRANRVAIEELLGTTPG